MKLRKEAKKLEEVEKERDIYEMLLMSANDMIEKYKLLCEAYKFAFDILAKNMCIECKQRTLSELIVSGALKLNPEALVKKKLS